MNYRASIFPSLKRRGGCAIKKYREATLVRPDGVVSSAKIFGPKDFAELTTPSAALRWLRTLLFMPQPPLLFKEGNIARFKFIHTFADRRYSFIATRMR
jgi:hypothetical protein